MQTKTWSPHSRAGVEPVDWAEERATEETSVEGVRAAQTAARVVREAEVEAAAVEDAAKAVATAATQIWRPCPS